MRTLEELSKKADLIYKGLLEAPEVQGGISVILIDRYGSSLRGRYQEFQEISLLYSDKTKEFSNFESYEKQVDRLGAVAIDYIKEGLEYIQNAYQVFLKEPSLKNFVSQIEKFLETIELKRRNGRNCKTSTASIISEFNKYIENLEKFITKDQLLFQEDLEKIKKKINLNALSEKQLTGLVNKIERWQAKLPFFQTTLPIQYFLNHQLQVIQLLLLQKKVKNLVDILQEYTNEGNAQFYNAWNNFVPKLKSENLKTFLEEILNKSTHFKCTRALKNITYQDSNATELEQVYAKLQVFKKRYNDKKIQSGLIEKHQLFHGEILFTMNEMFNVMQGKLNYLGIDANLFFDGELKKAYSIVSEDMLRTNLLTKSLSSIIENFFILVEGFDQKFLEIEKYWNLGELEKKTLPDLLEMKKVLEKIQPFVIPEKTHYYLSAIKKVNNQLLELLSPKNILNQKSIVELLECRKKLKSLPTTFFSEENFQQQSKNLIFLEETINKKREELNALSVDALSNLQNAFDLFQAQYPDENEQDLATYLKVLIQIAQVREDKTIQTLIKQHNSVTDFVYLKEAGEALRQVSTALLENIQKMLMSLNKNYADHVFISASLTALPIFQESAKDIISQVNTLKVVDDLAQDLSKLSGRIDEADRQQFENDKEKFDALLNNIRIEPSKESDLEIDQMSQILFSWDLKFLEQQFDSAYLFLQTLLEDKKYIRPLSKLDAVREFGGSSERRPVAYIEVCEESSTELTNKLPNAVEFRKMSIFKQEEILTLSNQIKKIKDDETKKGLTQRLEIAKLSKALDNFMEKFLLELETDKKNIFLRIIETMHQNSALLNELKKEIDEFKQLTNLQTWNEKILITQEMMLEYVKNIEQETIDLNNAVIQMASFKTQVDAIIKWFDVYKQYDQELNELTLRFQKAICIIPDSWKKTTEIEKFKRLFLEIKILLSEGYDSRDKIKAISKKTFLIEKTAIIYELLMLQQQLKAILEQIDALISLLPDDLEILQQLKKLLQKNEAEILYLGTHVKHCTNIDQINVLHEKISNLSEEIKTFPQFHEFKICAKNRIIKAFELNKKELMSEVINHYERLKSFTGQVGQLERENYFKTLEKILDAYQNKAFEMIDQEDCLELSKINILHDARKEFLQSRTHCKEALIVLYQSIKKDASMMEDRHEELRRCLNPDAARILSLAKKKMDKRLQQIGQNLNDKDIQQPEFQRKSLIQPSLNPFEHEVLETNNSLLKINPMYEEIQETVFEKDLFQILESYQAYDVARSTYHEKCHDLLKEIYYPKTLREKFFEFLSETQIDFFYKNARQLLTPSQVKRIRICLNELVALEKMPIEHLDIHCFYAFQTVKTQLLQLKTEIYNQIIQVQTQKIRNAIIIHPAYIKLHKRRDNLQKDLDKAKKAFIKPFKLWFIRTEHKINAFTHCLKTIENQDLKLSAIEGAVTTLKNDPLIFVTRGLGIRPIKSIKLVDAFVKAVDQEKNKSGDLSIIEKAEMAQQERGNVIQQYIHPYLAKLTTLDKQLLNIPEKMKVLSFNPFEEEIKNREERHQEILLKIQNFNHIVESLINQGMGHTALVQYMTILEEINQFNQELSTTKYELKKRKAEKIQTENKEMIAALKFQYEKLELPDGYEKIPHDKAEAILKEIKTLVLELDHLLDNRKDLEDHKKVLEQKIKLFEIEREKIQAIILKNQAPLPEKVLHTLGKVGNDVEKTVKKGKIEIENFFKNLGKTVTKNGDKIVQTFNDMGNKIGQSPSPSSRKISNYSVSYFAKNNQEGEYPFDQMEVNDKLPQIYKQWLNKNRTVIEDKISQLIFDGDHKKAASFMKQAKDMVNTFKNIQLANFEKRNNTGALQEKFVNDCNYCKKFITDAFNLSPQEKKKAIQSAVFARLHYVVDNIANWNEEELVNMMTDKVFYMGYFFKVYSWKDASLRSVMEEIRGSGNDQENTITLGEIGKEIKQAPVIREISTGIDLLKEVPGVGHAVSVVCTVGNVVGSLVSDIEIEKPAIEGNIPFIDQPVQLLFHKRLSQFFEEENRYLKEAAIKYREYECLGMSRTGLAMQ